MPHNAFINNDANPFYGTQAIQGEALNTAVISKPLCKGVTTPTWTLLRCCYEQCRFQFEKLIIDFGDGWRLVMDTRYGNDVRCTSAVRVKVPTRPWISGARRQRPHSMTAFWRRCSLSPRHRHVNYRGRLEKVMGMTGACRGHTFDSSVLSSTQIEHYQRSLHRVEWTLVWAAGLCVHTIYGVHVYMDM